MSISGFKDENISKAEATLSTEVIIAPKSERAKSKNSRESASSTMSILTPFQGNSALES